MHPPPHGTKGDATYVRSCVRVCLLLLMLGHWGAAQAMPGFTRQTGQPCAACHVGPVGSPLGPYGPQVTLDYYAVETRPSWRPLSTMILPVSFTLTSAPRPGDNRRGDLRVPGADVTTGVADTSRNVWNAPPVWMFPYPLLASVSPPGNAAPVDGAAGPADGDLDARAGLHFTGSTGGASGASNGAGFMIDRRHALDRSVLAHRPAEGPGASFLCGSAPTARSPATRGQPPNLAT